MAENVQDRTKVLQIAGVRNKTLLDIGVGPLAIIAARDFNCRVTSIDTSAEALENAGKEALKDNIEQINFEKEDATDLSYKADSFDIVISYGALHHVPLDKREKLVHEAYRVAEEKVIIAEFTDAGFPHSEDEYAKVNLDWLELNLDCLGRTEKYTGRWMNVYVCFKQQETKMEELFEKIGVERNDFEDLHVTRMFSSFVAISNGRVVGMTQPYLEYCPLADRLHRHMRKRDEPIEEIIKKTVEEKISRFGYFTQNRELQREDIVVPFGASEMMFYAMQKGIADSAVVVCDGAGTVVVDRPEVVQGIGARMNGVFYTTPINKTMQGLERQHSHVAFPETAHINQIEGIKRAVKLGKKKVIVTINGYIGENLRDIRQVGIDSNISVTSLVVCTTGVGQGRIEEIEEYADLVWSCASEKIRKRVGKKAILQLSTAIPVFVLSEKGLDLVASYSDNEQLIRELSLEKQYLISGKHEGTKLKMGNFYSYLSEAKLPVRSESEPRPLA